MTTQTIQPNELSKRLTDSRKKKFYACSRNGAINTASYWDSGSRSCFYVWNAKTDERKQPPCGSYPTFDASYTLQPNEIVIETGTFMGKPATPRLYYRSDDAALFVQLFGEIQASAY